MIRYFHEKIVNGDTFNLLILMEKIFYNEMQNDGKQFKYNIFKNVCEVWAPGI